MARVRFSKSRSRNSGRARARSAQRAPRRTCAPARSTDLPGLRRSCSRRDAIAISQRGRGWDGRGGRPEEVTRARIAFSKPSGKSDVVRSRRSARRRVYVFAPPRRAGKARVTHHVDERGRYVRQGLARACAGRLRRCVGERSRIRCACARERRGGSRVSSNLENERAR